MGCPNVRGDNPRALAMDILRTGGQTWYNYFYHIYQCRPYTSRESLC